MGRATLLIYVAAVMAIGLNTKARTLEKFVLGDTLSTRAMVATIMSTVNSFLQSGAASLAVDALRHFRPQASDRQLLTFSRVFVVVLGLLSLMLALWFQMIVPALLFTLSIWTAGMLMPTLAALLGKRLSARSGLYSLLGGAFSCLAWSLLQPCEVDGLFVGLASSLLIAVISEAVSTHSG